MKRAIEESFPIVEINRLAIPERNAFKPIYQMHKWFARRASCVFRAILLAAMKPDGTNIMEEFYKDHTNDPDTNNVRILDPFMGGGTTVVEALRLGCNVTGIDLNPVAWFIVKTEIESVEIEELEEAFERLAQRKTASGKSVKEELLNHYKTDCPCCGEEADVIYTFWVKSAICTNPTCKKQVPLFKEYIIAQKSPSTRYIPDYECPHCKKTFDLDIEIASLIAQSSLTVENPLDSAGVKRGNKRWTFIDNFKGKAKCPWCYETFESKGTIDKKVRKPRKKVPLTALLCPECRSVWQIRGTLPDRVQCPICGKEYNPKQGNYYGSKGETYKKKFICSCGTPATIIDSVRKLSSDQLLPAEPYAIEGYCPNCAGENNAKSVNLFGESEKGNTGVVHSCYINKNNGKFFKKIEPADLKRYQDAELRWQQERDGLPYPKSEIPDGQETHRLLEHHYKYWHQMFNPRQLLCLSTLLKAIDEEPDQALKEMLLSAFFQALRNQCMFCFYNPGRDELEPLFSRKDYAPPQTCCENSIWGTRYGRGTFQSVVDKIIRGKKFCWKPYDRKFEEYKGTTSILSEIQSPEVIRKRDDDKLLSMDARLYEGDDVKYDLVITDPPYAANVNYSEVADFFYVWLRLLLSTAYPWYSPEFTPKASEIVEHKTRGKSLDDFKNSLSQVFRRSNDMLVDTGLLAFTYHHQANEAWAAVLEAIFNAGFYLESVYPYESDARKGGSMGAQKIAYDLIHVCKKRQMKEAKKRSWAGVRQEIRRKAREEIKLMESGRYGPGQLLPADVNIILIGKCLELYSKHYGKIVDYKEEVVPLTKALASIRLMVEMMVNTENPLPSELENVDLVSYVYLTCLCDRKEIKSDEVHKATRGGFIEPDVLLKAGVIRKGRAKRGRTYEVKLPDERLKDLEKVFGKKDRYAGGQAFLFPELEQEWFDNIRLVDVTHYLMALAITGENITPWLRIFNPVIVPVRVALEYMMQKNPTFQEPIQKVVNLIEV